MRTNTQTRNKEKPSKPTSSKASTKLTLYPSSEISNRSLKNIAGEHSAQTATSLDTGRKIVVSTNAHTATYINPTTRSIYVFFEPSDLMVTPKPLSNKNRPHHHLSPSTSPIREGSEQGNPHHPLPLQQLHRPPMEESIKTREKGRRIITPANKEGSKGKLTEPLTT